MSSRMSEHGHRDRRECGLMAIAAGDRGWRDGSHGCYGTLQLLVRAEHGRAALTAKLQMHHVGRLGLHVGGVATHGLHLSCVDVSSCSCREGGIVGAWSNCEI